MEETRSKDTRDPRTYAIIGAAIEVHKQLGHGFLEPVYQEALAIEMTGLGIPHRREVELPILYKGQRLTASYRPDFICFDAIVVELKALAQLGPTEEAQIINYLKASGHETGLLLNFGGKSLTHRRFIRTTTAKQAERQI